MTTNELPDNVVPIGRGYQLRHAKKKGKDALKEDRDRINQRVLRSNRLPTKPIKE